MVSQVALTGLLLNALHVGAHYSRLVHSAAAVGAAFVAMFPFFPFVWVRISIHHPRVADFVSNLFIGVCNYAYIMLLGGNDPWFVDLDTFGLLLLAGFLLLLSVTTRLLCVPDDVCCDLEEGTVVKGYASAQKPMLNVKGNPEEG